MTRFPAWIPAVAWLVVGLAGSGGLAVAQVLPSARMGLPSGVEDGVVRFDVPVDPDGRARLELVPGRVLYGAEGARDGRPTHLYGLRGPSLRDLLGPGEHDAATIGLVSDALLAANGHLIGLPAGAGHLARTRVLVHSTSVGAIYEQRSASGLPVFGSLVRLNWNPGGEPAALLNVTFTDVDALPAPALSAAEVERRIPALLARIDWRGGEQRFAAEHVAVLRSGILPLQAGGLRTAFEVEVAGRLPDSPTGLHKAHMLAYVDGLDGSLLELVPGEAYAQEAPVPAAPFTEQGVVEFYDPHPALEPWSGNDIPAGVIYTLPVFNLDAGFAELRSPEFYLTAATLPWSFTAQPDSPAEAGYTFIPTSWGWPKSLEIFHTTPFKHLEDGIRQLRAYGFNVLNDVQIEIFLDFGAIHYPYSRYVRALKRIALVLLDLVDRSTASHELLHAVACGTSGAGLYGCALSIPDQAGGDPTNSLNEGVAMYFATSASNSPSLSAWTAYNYDPTAAVAFMDSSKSLDNWTADQYLNGAIWASANWTIRKTLGSDADRLAIQFLYHLTPNSDFQAALEAVIQADEDLFAGAHEATIRKAFSMHKIYGVAPPPSWSTPFLMSATRPYANDATSTQAYTIPGAASLRVSFDAFTKVNENDELVVTDGAGQPVAGSPFLKEALRGRTIDVPGDTVRITLDSDPLDQLGGAGYLVTNVAGPDPGNVPPVLEVAVSTGQPVAAFPPPAITEGTEPFLVTFDLAGSVDPDGTIVQVNLDPGDGSPLITLDWPAVGSLRHLYHRDGTGPILATTDFEARFEATDDSGATSVMTRTIRVQPYHPAGHTLPTVLVLDPRATSLGGARPCYVQVTVGGGGVVICP